ncbi:hypothetical protein LXL04_025432 [Taraxacum kok-saghyz]
MPRHKVKLAFITETYARRASLKKRKDNLTKKLNEICTLCGVDACAIMYNSHESRPDLWPSRRGVQNVLEKLNGIPDIQRGKKMLDHDEYIKKRITKMEDMVMKQIRENREMEMANKMSECLSGERLVSKLSTKDLKDLVLVAGNKMSEIEHMIKLRKKGVPAEAQPVPEPQDQVVYGCSNMDYNHMMVAGGVAADGYVPVVENHGNFGGMQTGHEWLGDWATDNMVEHFGS